MDIQVGLGLKALDLVDPRLQFSVFKDGRGVAGRVQGHGWQGKFDNVGNTRIAKLLSIPACQHAPATLFPGVCEAVARPLRSHGSRLYAMTPTSTTDSVSIFKDRKLKPGIYKIHNIRWPDIPRSTRSFSTAMLSTRHSPREWERVGEFISYMFGHHRGR